MFQRVLERLETGRPGDAGRDKELLQLLEFEFQRCGLTVPEVHTHTHVEATHATCTLGYV
jgi:hypothetical protein